MNNTIYMDNSATTPLLPEVSNAMRNALALYGNPSSLYSLGQNVKAQIDEARYKISRLVNCAPESIIFTSGGSEADNMALISAYDKAQLENHRKNHIIVSSIEHHAILNTCKYLEKYRGARISYLDVDCFGNVDLEQIERFICDETILISVMFVNNEIGTIQDVYRIAKLAHEHGVLFHSDCVQAFGHLDIDVATLDMDMFSASAHKLGGPKGIGCLYLREGLELPSFIHGGGQESGRRASTENVLGVIGFGEAANQARKHIFEWNEYIIKLTDYMSRKIRREVQGATLNGRSFPRLPGNLNFSIDGIRGEELLIMLDMYGICISTGSACNSASAEPSHVLKAIGLSDEQANSSIRISLSYLNTYEEVNFVVDKIKICAERLRNR